MALTGKVVRFDDMRGYGFIAPDKGGEDVFVHANVLGEDKYVFCPGLPVEFEVTEGDRGLKAYSVRILMDHLQTPVAAAPAATRVAPAPAAIPVPRPPATVTPAPAAALAGHVSADLPDDSEELCDVLTASAFGQELTELFLDSAPTLTAAQIKQVRDKLIELGKRYGWVES